MGKHTDKLGKFEEFRAPWETADGSEAEIEKPKLKRWIFNLLADKAKSQDARDEATDKVAEIEKELETAQTELASANGEEAQKKIKKLEGDLADAKAKVTELETAKEQADLRAEVLEGLDSKYAKYVTGTTREELEKSLEEVKADFGLEDGDDNEDENEDDEPRVRTTPRTSLRNGADPKNGKPGEQTVDFDKVADGIVGSSLFS